MGHPELAAGDLPDEPIDRNDELPDILPFLHRRPKGQGPGPDFLIGAALPPRRFAEDLSDLQLHRHVANDPWQRPCVDASQECRSGDRRPSDHQDAPPAGKVR